MNPMDPRIAHAMKEIETVYAGQESSHAYYDPKLKFYVLVVSGKEAEGYHNAVAAIHALASAKRRAAKTAK